jgi:hypothetical protein
MADVAAKAALDDTMYALSEVVNQAGRLCKVHRLPQEEKNSRAWQRRYNEQWK